MDEVNNVKIGSILIPEKMAFAHGDPTNGGNSGMSLRDWFAGQAVIGLLSVKQLEFKDNPEIAVSAYQLADALILASEGMTYEEILKVTP